MSKKIIVIMGPTAVGKTALGVSLAKQYNGEVINGDSLQVYRQLDIGTAKATEEEMQGVPHHLLDIVDINAPYTASDFKEAAETAIQIIHDKGKIPILVGGSGLYIQGLLNDMQFGRAGEDPAFRAELEKWPPFDVWQRLKEIDPKAAEDIHINNTRRVIRALESIHTSGELFSSQKETVTSPKYDALLVALDCDREVLYNRINQRVDLMVEAGLLDEAKMLYELRNSGQNQAHKGIGYKEWFAYFDGEVSFEEAKEKVKQNSRRYAKRQLTWFRNRMGEVHWFDVLSEDYPQKVTELVNKFIKL